MEKIKLNELESTVKSSFRTLSLFEYFAEIKRPATVKEICHGIQIPQSIASAIIKSLLDISYLSFDPTRRAYEPTMRMAFLSHWKIEKNINAATIPFLMKRLQNQTEDTIVLAMRICREHPLSMRNWTD